MEITLVSRNRTFLSSVEHDGERVELTAGRPVDVPAKVARDVISEASDYDLEVIEGRPKSDDAEAESADESAEGESAGE